MAGALMQLVAYGAQDVYLTGRPEITFFKASYERHTNFALESIEQTFNGTTDFGRKVSATIARSGDLVGPMTLEVSITGHTGNDSHWPANAGHAIIDEVDIEVGGQRIDRQYGWWLQVWSELTLPSGKETGYGTMVQSTRTAATNVTANVLYVPLQFWFNRNAGLYLPLIALQYHEVKCNITFQSAKYMLTGDTTTPTDTATMTAKLYVDYIFLDTDERREFAQNQHEYLIEQLQFTGAESVAAGSQKVRLNFNHPVKELMFFSLTDANETAGHYFSYTHQTTSAKLQLNGHDRFSERGHRYFTHVQPYYHHTNIPGSAIYCYSFALKPEEHQPSGTCNFSRIDNATLQLTNAVGSDGNMTICATNYNIFRVVSGMGGLAYAN